MTKLEELKAAYVATGEGMSGEDADLIPTVDCRFYDIAHNMMPTLLDAVIELTKFIDYLDTASGDGAYEHEIQRALAILEKLK